MSLLDPFNPRPGPAADEDWHRRPAGMQPPGSGRSFLWVPAVIVGGIGVLVVVAAL